MTISEDDLAAHFDAEKTETQPSEEELEYVRTRSQIEADAFPLLSIEQYEENYERFCEYGLEEKMLKKVEPHIRYLSRFEPRTLLESRFYERFQDEKIVRQYVEENINLKTQTSDE